MGRRSFIRGALLGSAAVVALGFSAPSFAFANPGNLYAEMELVASSNTSAAKSLAVGVGNFAAAAGGSSLLAVIFGSTPIGRLIRLAVLAGVAYYAYKTSTDSDPVVYSQPLPPALEDFNDDITDPAWTFRRPVGEFNIGRLNRMPQYKIVTTHFWSDTILSAQQISDRVGLSGPSYMHVSSNPYAEVAPFHYFAYFLFDTATFNPAILPKQIVPSTVPPGDKVPVTIPADAIIDPDAAVQAVKDNRLRAIAANPSLVDPAIADPDGDARRLRAAAQGISASRASETPGPVVATDTGIAPAPSTGGGGGSGETPPPSGGGGSGGAAFGGLGAFTPDPMPPDPGLPSVPQMEAIQSRTLNPTCPSIVGHTEHCPILNSNQPKLKNFFYGITVIAAFFRVVLD